MIKSVRMKELMVIWNYATKNGIITWGNITALGAFGVFAYFFKGWWESRNENSKRRAQEKRDIANEILKLISKAEMWAYTKLARKPEDMQFLINKAEGVDKKVAKKLN